MTETKRLVRWGHSKFKPSCLFRIGHRREAVVGFVLRISVAVSLYMVSVVPAAAAEVRLRSTAACTAAVVRLADVAEIFCDDVHVAAALADVSLCPAPSTLSQRTLTQHDVRQLLVLSGVERSDCRVTGSEAVTVTAEPSQGARPLAKRPLVATGVRQALFTEEANVRHERQPAKPAATPFPEAKLPTALPLVERGATVTVNARAAGVRITTSGKSLDAGAVGETVNVELADTKQRVLAHVIGPQVVELAVGGSPAAVAPASAPGSATAANR